MQFQGKNVINIVVDFAITFDFLSLGVLWNNCISTYRSHINKFKILKNNRDRSKTPTDNNIHTNTFTYIICNIDININIISVTCKIFFYGRSLGKLNV